MLADIDKAKIVITNYHSFRPKERVKVTNQSLRAPLAGAQARLNERV
jgi:hypothetical protein